MNPLDRIPLSLRMMVRGLVFLVRMWASERRFQRHAQRRRQHAAESARHLAGMEAEPPRDFRRLQLLRDWSHDEAYPTLFP